MKNHFIISYAGNKRQEVETIHNYIKDKLEGIETIIEPFCGTSAMSYFISLQYPNRFKYILNDLDANLIALYNVMKNKEQLKKFTEEYNEKIRTITDKESYLGITKEPTLMSWFIKHKIYQIRAGLCPVKLVDFTKQYYNFEDLGIVKFLQSEDVSISCGNG